jgi:formylmethanofuran dehydrogenase subunit E
MKLDIFPKNYIAIQDIKDLLPQILYLKKNELSGIQCEKCGNKKDLSIYFNKKNPTYYDLKLLCKKCYGYKSKTSIIRRT